MLDRLRPVHALPAALAAWATGLLVLAFAGLGGRVGLHPEDPALAPPVPELRLAAVTQRLGPLAAYSEVGTRPLLTADRRPAAVVAAGEAGNPDALKDLVLSSVLIAGPTRLAILQPVAGGEPVRVREGDAVPGSPWRLVELAPRRAVFEGPSGRHELALRTFDGRGAAPPRAGEPMAGGPPGTTPAPANSPATAMPATPAAGAVAASPAGEAGADEPTQEQQIEAIRRRIEARRAQMRAEAAARE